MAQQDIVIAKSGGSYVLSALTPVASNPTYDGQRIASRFIAQFLSCTNAETSRGSIFMDALKSGLIRTSADVVSIFSTAASSVIQYNNLLSYDVNIKFADLLNFTFVDNKTITLTVRLTYQTGTLISTFTVTA